AAGGRADVVVLGPDAGAGEAAPYLPVVEVEGQQPGDPGGHGALERGRAGQARTERHVRVDRGVEAGNLVTVVAQCLHHAGDVRRPAVGPVLDAPFPAAV